MSLNPKYQLINGKMEVLKGYDSYTNKVVNNLLENVSHIDVLTSLFEAIVCSKDYNFSYYCGKYRIVIHTDYNFVIKISKEPKHFDNIIEYKTYHGLKVHEKEFKGSKYKHKVINITDYFACPYAISSNGLVLLQEKAIPVFSIDYLKEGFPSDFPVPEVFIGSNDFHLNNFGIIEPNNEYPHRRLVVFDYGMVDFQLQLGKNYKFVPFSELIKHLS